MKRPRMPPTRSTLCSPPSSTAPSAASCTRAMTQLRLPPARMAGTSTRRRAKAERSRPRRPAGGVLLRPPRARSWRWHGLYKHDAALRLPYQDNLSALIHEPTLPARRRRGGLQQGAGHQRPRQPGRPQPAPVRAGRRARPPCASCSTSATGSPAPTRAGASPPPGLAFDAGRAAASRAARADADRRAAASSWKRSLRERGREARRRCWPTSRRSTRS